MAALQAWRDAQALALDAEADLSVALNAELAGGPKVPEELETRVKQCRALAEARLGLLIALMESRHDLKL